MTAAHDARMAYDCRRTRPGSRGGRVATFPLYWGCCADPYDSFPKIVILRMHAGAACLIIEAWDRQPKSPVPPDVKVGEETGLSPRVAGALGLRPGRYPRAGGKVARCECVVPFLGAGRPGYRNRRGRPPWCAPGPRNTGGPVMAVSSWARAFPGTPEQVRIARRFVASLLDGSPVRDDAVYAASELFTNGVRHTASGRPGGTDSRPGHPLAAGRADSRHRPGIR